jgi:hypothetical protein
LRRYCFCFLEFLHLFGLLRRLVQEAPTLGGNNLILRRKRRLCYVLLEPGVIERWLFAAFCARAARQPVV